MRRAVVEDQVKVLAGIIPEEATQEADKGVAVIVFNGLAADLAAVHFEGREQRRVTISGRLCPP